MPDIGNTLECLIYEIRCDICLRTEGVTKQRSDGLQGVYPQSTGAPMRQTTMSRLIDVPPPLTPSHVLDTCTFLLTQSHFFDICTSQLTQSHFLDIYTFPHRQTHIIDTPNFTAYTFTLHCYIHLSAHTASPP